ncbi:efflux RND transporter periplasmic adaptor subunit [Phyllobacterium salinisoli]|uniref:Efflux RND transporter periplasmic adaptor subunit n=1 Tax=Phyllobacterium salinisoli TaxID=1899321 RepID=A0A368K300_9HYPH|nr:efflux RND transporter periplasmic adaptor subunit [Phyllobacterium salinisoli]RCS23757.1 efflux RND transporter periplasmic adaptor subunit [Phyllobacterium salinisoli]
MPQTVPQPKNGKGAAQAPEITVFPGSANPPRRRARRRIWPWLAVAAALAIAAGVALFPGLQGEQTTNYLTEPVTRGDIENAITAVGTLSAIKDVNVGAQVSGQLRSVLVEIGDKVKENQLIAEIDPSSIQTKVEISSAQVDNLKAQLVSKEAQLILKQGNADRQRKLLATRGVSQATVDQADADLAAAQADVKALQAQIRMQEAQLSGDKVDLGYTNIYTPMAGTVVDQAAKEGETLNANQTTPTIVTVADLSTMTVEAQVSEADVGKLKIGMPAYFTLLGQPGKRFTGTLRQIKPTPDTTNNVVLYYALFDVPNPDGDLMINMSAQVYFLLGSAKDVLLVPTAALNTTRGPDGKRQTIVKVVNASGGTEDRVVELGIRNRVQAEVKSGLKEDDRVVVTSGTSGTERQQGGNSRRMRMPRMF